MFFFRSTILVQYYNLHTTYKMDLVGDISEPEGVAILFDSEEAIRDYLMTSLPERPDAVSTFEYINACVHHIPTIVEIIESEDQNPVKKAELLLNIEILKKSYAEVMMLTLLEMVNFLLFSKGLKILDTENASELLLANKHKLTFKQQCEFYSLIKIIF